MKSPAKKTKDIDYFMRLPYRIEIDPIPESDGGGFTASIPELGSRAVCADGDTKEEALKTLELVQRERLTAYLRKGVTIPEPIASDEVFSGKFVVRLPKSLHRALSLRARDEGVSLNSFVVSLLSWALGQITQKVGSKTVKPGSATAGAVIRAKGSPKVDYRIDRKPQRAKQKARKFSAAA